MHTARVSAEQLIGKPFGNYCIEQLLGQGQLSAVYLAYRRNSLQRVMLTVFLLPFWCEGARWSFFMDRFSRIASVLVTLDHPHIVPTYDFGEVYSYPYLVTAFTEEVSLASVLRDQGRCTPAQVLFLLKQITSALDYACAKGMVHGSLRTGNILLDSQQRVHISGFGLARILASRDLVSVSQLFPHLYSLANTLLYSPEYVAPEVVQGKLPDTRSDLYSLGVILYELLCGRPPFIGEDPAAVAMQLIKQPVPSLQQVYPQAPVALDFVIQRALDRDPERRFQSGAKMARTFESVLKVLAEAEQPASHRQDNVLLDISQRPTLHWFEADSSLYIQWKPQVPVTEGVPAVDISKTATRTSEPANASPLVSVGRSLPNTDKQRKLRQAPPFPQPPPAYASKQVAAPRPKHRSRRVSRRAMLIATGGVVAAASVVAAGSVAFSHFYAPAGGQPAGNMPSEMKTAQNKKAISSIKQAENSTKDFTNPADNNASLLIRLPEGKFVAFESACTHQGVTMNYDPVTHNLVCPRHGAIFDPTNNAAVLRGPAGRPLPAVTIHIQAGGTIAA